MHPLKGKKKKTKNQNILIQQTPWKSDPNKFSKDQESTDFRSPTAISIPNNSSFAK